MAASVLSRTISAAVDKRIVLSNDQIGRKIGIGSTWTTLRVGFRFAINNNGLAINTPTVAFQFGLCSGTTNMIGSATTTNGIGVSFGQATSANAMTYYAGPYFSGSFVYGFKRVGSVLTATSTNVGPPSSAMYCTGNVEAKRNAILFEIVKGSPNYTIRAAHPAGGAATTYDVSASALLAGMEALDFAGAASALNSAAGGVAVTSGTGYPLAFDEVAGALDSINIRWSLTSRPLEISDVLYCRIA